MSIIHFVKHKHLFGIEAIDTPLVEDLMLNGPNVTHPFCKTLAYIWI